MFWGLTLKANRRYTQTLKKAFHLSNAALDIHSCKDNDVVQVVVTHDGHDYVVCNLRKNRVEQVQLDLTFGEGEEIAFTSQGNGNVHLSGYLLLEDDVLSESDDASEAEEMQETEAVNEAQSKKKNANKKKNDKKATLEDLLKSDATKNDDDDDEDEDDSDFQIGEDDDDEEGIEDEDEDEDEDDDEEDDDEDESEDEEAQEPKLKQIKLDNKAKQQNGLENGEVKKKKKDKQKQQQQQQQQKQQKQKEQKQDQDKSAKGEKTLQGGVKVEDIQAGNGPEAKPGKKVQVYYEGRLKQNNKVFDSMKEGKGFKFSLGKGEVIKGWDIGVAGMKVGGKRRITCPPHMAYGAKGHPPVIPPNSTLVFEVELKGVI